MCASLNVTTSDVLNVCLGTTIDQVKNGASAPFLQIRDGLGANRGLKGRPKKKKKGEAVTKCQTGMKSTRRRVTQTTWFYCPLLPLYYWYFYFFIVSPQLSLLDLMECL